MKTKPTTKVSRKPSYAQKTRALVNKMRAKTKRANAKAAYRHAKHKANLEKGGPVGYFARKKEQAIVKAESKRKMEALKPKLMELRDKTTIQTEADVKKVNAKYKGYAAVASALGSAYFGGKKADQAIEESKTRAIEAGTGALEAELNSIPEVTTDGGKSVSGLVTGVR